MTTRLGKLVLGTLVSLALTAGSAAAQDPEAAPPPVAEEGTAEAEIAPAGAVTKDTYPMAVIDRPLQVIAGMFEIAGNTVGVNLSSDAVGKPFFMAPSLYYGITDHIAVGLFHSIGLCLTGEENGCLKPYNDIGLDFRYYLVPSGSFLLSAHAGVQFASFDPSVIQLPVGAYGQYVFSPKLAILFDPTVTIELKDALSSFAIPVWLGYQFTPQLWTHIFTAFGGPFDGFGDAYTGSLGVGATYAITRMIDVGADFHFTNLYGKRLDGVGAADGRLLVLRFALRI